MADAIDNLAQDLNQSYSPGNQGKMYLVGDQYLPFGALVPNMAGVRVGDEVVNDIGDRWNWDINDYDYAPSTSATGGEIDYNIPDSPTERINVGSGDEQDAFVRTGIGTTLDPKTEDTYGVKGLVSPYQAGGFVGVNYLDPSQVADVTAGQTPSVSQGVVSGGGIGLIPGRKLPDYTPIGVMENGDVIYADKNNLRDTIIRPGASTLSPEDVEKGVMPDLSLLSTLNKGTGTSTSPAQTTQTPFESYQPIGSDERKTSSVGNFENTGGKLTAGPGAADDTIRFNPDYVKPESKPEPVPPFSTIDPTAPTKKPIVTPDGLTEGTVVPGTGGIKVGDYYPDGEGNKWNWEKGEWEKDPAQGGTPKPPVVTPPVKNPPGGTPPGGGAKPPGGTPPGGSTTIIPPREPVTPLVRNEVVIPTKGTKEVPLPDRQADPFAKLYADLLASSQQQQDQYRYINYDPEQIMNAAMSGFRRRGAMRSLQG